MHPENPLLDALLLFMEASGPDHHVIFTDAELADMAADDDRRIEFDAAVKRLVKAGKVTATRVGVDGLRIAKTTSGKLDGLPVHGYQPQSADKVALVNEFKQDEERLLRKIDALDHVSARNVREEGQELYDMRWARIARTHFQEGFMALNRAVFQPQRISLPEDEPENKP